MSLDRFPPTLEMFPSSNAQSSALNAPSEKKSSSLPVQADETMSADTKRKTLNLKLSADVCPTCRRPLSICFCASA